MEQRAARTEMMRRGLAPRSGDRESPVVLLGPAHQVFEEKPPPGVAPGSPAYEAGASLPMLRRRKVRRGVAPRYREVAALGLTAMAHGPCVRRVRTREDSHPMPSRAPRAFQARPAPRPDPRPVVHVIGAAGLAPASSASQTRRPAPGPRPTDVGGLAPHSHAGSARLSRAARRLVRFGIQTLRPGLAPGTVRLTAGRSTLELTEIRSGWRGLHSRPLRPERSALLC